jgi:hypothetical protein
MNIPKFLRKTPPASLPGERGMVSPQRYRDALQKSTGQVLAQQHQIRDEIMKRASAQIRKERA